MKLLVWRNGTGLPDLPPDTLRTVVLFDDEDEVVKVQRYMDRDKTLTEYLGAVELEEVMDSVGSESLNDHPIPGPHPKRHFLLPGAETFPSVGGVGENRIPLRSCWRWENGRIIVSTGLLRSEYLKVLRQERDRRLEQSDKEVARLNDVGTPQQLAAMKSHRQKLRDMPITVETALGTLSTVADIEAYSPAWPTV